MKAVIGYATPFAEKVDEWVRGALHAGARDLDSLVRNLPGVYPVEAIESLTRLARRRLIARSTAEAIISAKSVPFRARGYQTVVRLPVPHPLDYDWRFTREAVDMLLRVCRKSGNDLVCLGSPTVFVKAAAEFGSDKVVLLDRNVTVIQHLEALVKGARIFCVDILVDAIPFIQADLVVADPPWYPEYMLAFLWAASRICRLGGHVLVSLPPRGTRVTVIEEVDRLIVYSKRLGFIVRRVVENCLPYETPPFESNALRAAGCHLSAQPWRRGTLAVFERIATTNVERPRCSADIPWSEAALYGTRFRFRGHDRSSRCDPTLVPLVNGDVLPTVSRREPLREYVDVWSSGNRVFRCSAPDTLRQIVELLGAGTNPHDAVVSTGMPFHQVSKRLIGQAVTQITELATMERNERQFIGEG